MKTIRPLLILLSLTFCACGTATVARRDANSGQVTFSGSYMAARSEAQLLVAEECQGQFDVTESQHGLSYRCRRAAEQVAPTLVSWVGR